MPNDKHKHTPQTATQKLIAASTHLDSIQVGQVVECDVNLTMANAQIAFEVACELKDKSIPNPSKVALVLDDLSPIGDRDSAAKAKAVREFASLAHIRHFYDVGRAGEAHVLLAERGLVKPFSIVAGTRHCPSFGALGCVGINLDSHSLAQTMLDDGIKLSVPPAIKVRLDGCLGQYVSGKDVFLTLLNMLGDAKGKSLEFDGNISALSLDDRFTIADMAAECGAFNTFFPLDEESMMYLVVRGACNLEYIKRNAVLADDSAVYERTIDLNLSTIRQTIAHPPYFDLYRMGDDMPKLPINQVVIGGSSGGRFSDLCAAAEILQGSKVARGVRCLVVPATQEVYDYCIEEGIIDILLQSGATVLPPACGIYQNQSVGMLASGENCICTANGHTSLCADDTSVFLASPYVCAMCAAKGYLCFCDDEEQ